MTEQYRSKSYLRHQKSLSQLIRYQVDDDTRSIFNQLLRNGVAIWTRNWPNARPNALQFPEIVNLKYAFINLFINKLIPTPLLLRFNLIEAIDPINSSMEYAFIAYCL